MPNKEQLYNELVVLRMKLQTILQAKKELIKDIEKITDKIVQIERELLK